MQKKSSFAPQFFLCTDQLLDAPARLKLAEDLQVAASSGFDSLMLSYTGETDEEALALAQTAGMKVYFRLSLDRPKAGSALLIDHPQLKNRTGEGDDDLPDPRKANAVSQRPGLSFHTPAAVEIITDWWIGELKSLARKGVSGFCLHLDGIAPPSFFGDVISSVRSEYPSCRFVAWTLGVPAHRVEGISTCGFDAAFLSGAWWDFRASWFQEDCQRLRAFGDLIALAQPPDDHRGASTSIDERHLWLAAATADSLLITGNVLRNVDHDILRAVLKKMTQRPEHGCRSRHDDWQLISAPFADVAVLQRGTSATGHEASDPWLLVVNTTDRPVAFSISQTLAAAGLESVLANSGTPDLPEAGHGSLLQAHEHRIIEARGRAMVVTATKEVKRTAEASVKQAAKAPRVAIEAVTPSVDDGRFVVKRAVGDTVDIEADIFGEGHDRIAACLLWRAADEEAWQESPMSSVVNDRWRGELVLPRIGRFHYRVQAWIDVFGAYRDEIRKKSDAGQQIELELREGGLLLDAAQARAETTGRKDLLTIFSGTRKSLDAGKNQQKKVELMLSPELLEAMTQVDPRPFKVDSTVMQMDAERKAASFSSWYELFPRSLGRDGSKHGTFLDVIPRLPAIRAMGFDTLYFPPIHPIGKKFRKGRNNSLTPAETDPGSPYAIGSDDGGHDAIHPELGTLEDFRVLRQAADDHGLELALDYAIQCSPDHPWLKEHPDWFSWRPDGTIRYAENPPKKYQDIVNVDFYADGAVPQLWLALRNVVLFWVKEGVKVFRVDNPHTKPMPFWEWMIQDVRSRFPDVIFLAEAFTRPKPMYRLAKLGFSQSYTYFTWRHTKREFINYLTELADGAPRDFFRPHFFVNTPDINPYFLQRSGRAGFVIRAALATTLSGLWGMYSGFELCEAEPVPGKEEYLNSEKYEIRQRDWAQPGNIVREITLLNRIRRINPALQTHLGVRFCESSGEDILCFTKTSPGNILFIAICLDPHGAHECSFELPLHEWNVGEDAQVACSDLVHGNTFTLRGRHHRLRLDPGDMAFSIWRLQPGGITSWA